MNATTYGLDIAGRVFQLYWVVHERSEIHNCKFVRSFVQGKPTLFFYESVGLKASVGQIS